MRRRLYPQAQQACWLYFECEFTQNSEKTYSAVCRYVNRRGRLLSDLKNPKDKRAKTEARKREEEQDRARKLEMAHEAIAASSRNRTYLSSDEDPPRLHKFLMLETQINRLQSSVRHCEEAGRDDLLEEVKIALHFVAVRLERLLFHPDHLKRVLTSQYEAILHHTLLGHVLAVKFDLDPTSKHSLLVYDQEPPPRLKAPTIPSAPPGGETYDRRQDRKERAPDFIQRVYGPWLDGSLTRADLRKLDPKAEIALSNWERKNGRGDLNLPTKKELHDRLFAEGALNADDLAHSARLLAALSYRSKKT